MRTPFLMAVALMGLGACTGASPDVHRADNNMLRFSALEYAPVAERDW